MYVNFQNNFLFFSIIFGFNLMIVEGVLGFDLLLSTSCKLELTFNVFSSLISTFDFFFPGSFCCLMYLDLKNNQI